MDLFDNAFIKRYVEESATSLKHIYPQLSNDYIINFIKRKVLNTIKDQPVALQNTYTEYTAPSTLLSVLHYLETEKPIITGNGSFYVQHAKEIAPANDMLLNFKERRSELKEIMFKCRDSGDTVGEIKNDLGQNNEKIKMNSYYGAMGENSSFQYNVSCAGAITSQGRSIITATLWFLESFLANNIIFENLDDIMYYINQILQENDNIELYEWIDYVPEVNDVIKYIASKFESKDLNIRKSMLTALSLVVSKCTQAERVKLYYKCNLMELIDKNDKIKNLIINDIINDGTEWLDPNKIPKELDQPLDTLWNIVEEFVYMKNYLMYDKVNKYINHTRKVVMYSDTDSVFIYTGFWVFKFLKYMRGLDIRDLNMRELEKETPYILKMINIITRIIFIGIHKTYDTLTSNVNIDNKFRKYINIKNEFLMDRYVSFPNIKKNYINRIIVQEGNILVPPKLDVKGGNLNSKSKNAIVTKRVKSIIEKDTMSCDIITPEALLLDIKTFRDEIILSLLNGETKFLLPTKVKGPESYAKPYSQFKYCAVEAWRIAMSDNTIDLPGSFNIIDVTMGGIKDLTWLEENYPEQFNRLKNEYFSNPKLKNITYIALPPNIGAIPPWIMQYVDIDKIWRKHLNPLIALISSLGIKKDTIKSEVYYSTVLCV